MNEKSLSNIFDLVVISFLPVVGPSTSNALIAFGQKVVERKWLLDINCISNAPAATQNAQNSFVTVVYRRTDDTGIFNCALQSRTLKPHAVRTSLSVELEKTKFLDVFMELELQSLMTTSVDMNIKMGTNHNVYVYQFSNFSFFFIVIFVSFLSCLSVLLRVSAYIYMT